ncbi:uncharacterized protein LOC128997103 [Macrosteles quadrilineatus]|uniref:uncharacterized protein LOC128997103 n=1 Tax=Macrosteles quadrilineatus TaxID=74068 RepID=UPI0023E11DB2|nr:uncharacterized protein LOC128997103 [Macrosteles quadrilineatus]
MNLILKCFVLSVVVIRYGRADFRMFFNLEQVKEYFRNDSSLLANDILYTFEHECCSMEEKSISKDRRPFIVVEGNHRKSRNVIGMRVARLMRGRYLVHPSHCLQGFANQLPRGTMFRRAFYLLSMYAISYDVKFHLALGRAVVVNGYWWDMLTFALVQGYTAEDAPDVTAPDLQIPADLFRPDIIFFLNFPDNLHFNQVTTRSPVTWKPRVLKMYRDLQDKGEPVSVLNLKGLYRPTIDAVYETVLRNLSGTRDVWFEDGRVKFDYDGEGKDEE